MLLDLAALSFPLPLQDKYWEISVGHNVNLLTALLDFRKKKNSLILNSDNCVPEVVVSVVLTVYARFKL